MSQIGIGRCTHDLLFGARRTAIGPLRVAGFDEHVGGGTYRADGSGVDGRHGGVGAGLSGAATGRGERSTGWATASSSAASCATRCLCSTGDRGVGKRQTGSSGDALGGRVDSRHDHVWAVRHYLAVRRSEFREEDFAQAEWARTAVPDRVDGTIPRVVRVPGLLQRPRHAHCADGHVERQYGTLHTDSGRLSGPAVVDPGDCRHLPHAPRFADALQFGREHPIAPQWRHDVFLQHLLCSTSLEPDRAMEENRPAYAAVELAKTWEHPWRQTQVSPYGTTRDQGIS